MRLEDLVYVIVTSLITISLCEGVSVHFTRQDYGYLNETADSFVRLYVEKVGQFGSKFNVIIELEERTGDFRTNSYSIGFTDQSPSTLSVVVFVAEDEIPEDDETFRFRLRATLPSIRIDEPSVAHVTIPANDDAFGIIGFESISPVIANEAANSNTSVTLSLLRQKGNFGNVTVTYVITGNEGPVDDLYPIQGTVAISEGQSRKDFVIDVLDDQIPENDEEFTLVLTGTTGKLKINETTNSVSIIVKANDSPLRFEKRMYRAEEDSKSLKVAITRGKDERGNKIGSVDGVVSVDYSVTSGSATPVRDYIIEESKKIWFSEEETEAGVTIFLIDDNLPEVAENFTINLLPDSVTGDAIVARPMTCTVVIETNDNANGVLSIDFSQANYDLDGYDERVFVIREDEMESFSSLSVVRRGGTISRVTVRWQLTLNVSAGGDRDVIRDVVPTSGMLVFEEGQTRANLNLTVNQNDEPGEAKMLHFRLLSDYITGGATIESPSEAVVIVADSDDVYGVFDFDDDSSRIDVSGGQRSLLFRVERSGGLVGDVSLSYSSFYLPPGKDDIRDAMPGILRRSSGTLMFHRGDDSEEIRISIENEAFLAINSRFLIVLDSANLVDREVIIPPSTPRINTPNMTISVEERFANGEVGFLGDTELRVVEPSEEQGPSGIVIQLHREGVSGDARVWLSYRSVGDNALDVQLGSDYRKGPAIVHLPPGESSRNITVMILPDDIPEIEEAILIRLDRVEPSNQKLKRTASELRLIISENDSPGGVFGFSNQSALQYVIEEDETESVIINVVRDLGDLALRMVEYNVIPNGPEQFYGVPTTLVFPPGQRNAEITLVPINDDIPELDQNYSLVLLPHGNPASILAGETSINVTVLANDYPHGLFIFKDDEFTPRLQSIGESKGERHLSSHYNVKRSMGLYGDVSVSWKIIPDDSNDVTPTSGVLYFADQESEQIITVRSMADQLPESMEEFTFQLHNATGGSNIKDGQNATLIIEPNDKAIYFRGETDIEVEEGDTIVLTIHRDGSGADTTSVRYRTRAARFNDTLEQHRATADDDYQSVDDVNVIFQPGVLDVDVTIPILDDDIPEDDEQFYVELYNATRDYVTFGNIRVDVVVQQNDDANGVFSFTGPYNVSVVEGKPFTFRIQRSRGAFGIAALQWKIFRGRDLTYSDIEELQEVETLSEFEENEGEVIFEEGDLSKELILEALVDSVPEYDERFTLALLNVSRGSAKLSESSSSLMVRIVVQVNDHPFGWMSFPNATSPVMLPEDGNEDTDVTITVDREFGSDGKIKVLWELYPRNTTLPTRCKDLLMAGSLRGGASYVQGRPNTGTSAVHFAPSSYVIVENTNEEDLSENKITFSMWLKVDNTVDSGIDDVEVPLITHYDEQNSTVYSITLERRATNNSRIAFTYRANDTIELMESVSLNIEFDVNNSQWHHIVIVLDDDAIQAHEDGTFQDAKRIEQTLYDFVAADGRYMIAGGGVRHRDVTFHLVLQDVRLYYANLTSSQVAQLHRMSAQDDVTPISGYISYGPQVTSSNLTLRSTDDLETESSEDFLLVLMDASGGGRINRDNGSIVVTVLKSDNANGLFGFSRPCMPDHVTEGQVITCYVNRSRGYEGAVTVGWRAIFNRSTEDNEDFLQFHGEFEFFEGETEKSFNLTCADDNVPEIDELHTIKLTNATSLDGVASSAPFSGASVDEKSGSTTVVVERNDQPNGILQFSLSSPPTSSDNGRIPEASESPVAHVTEEEPHVTLMVVRAAGWFGHVTAEWRTRDATAVSRQEPKDFQSSAGTLTFNDGQGFAELTVKLFDDRESELEKHFFVELTTPTGGATLNNASRIKVVIEPSDDAFGIFEFNQTSVEIAEPIEGTNTTRLEVIRREGSLGQTTLHWKLRNNNTDDVRPTGGQIIFDEGQISEEIIIEVMADDLPEFDEDLKVDLIEATRGSLGASSHTSLSLVILANDDPRGLVTFDPTSILAYEDDRNVTLTLLRSGGLSGTIRVHYATMNTNPNNTAFEGIALPEQDFHQVVDSVLIGENVTTVNVTIMLINDDIPETNEVFFVNLMSVELVSSGVAVPSSPRLGSDRDIMTEVSIVENDSPHGVLELSLSTVTVQEDRSDNNTDAEMSNDDDVEAFLYVVRKLGAFGDVTVRVNVIPGSARSQEDYNLITPEVTLLDGETRKAVPIRIIPDFTPEVEEDFTVTLLQDSVTGGAQVSDEATCIVTISASDDPHGLLGISVDVDRVDEPASGIGVPVTFTVHRRNGHLGLVGLRWTVSVEPATSAASGGSDDGSYPADDGNDVDIQEGIVHFTTDETTQQFTLKILPDDLAEDDEVVKVRLSSILPNYRGRIDPKRNEAQVLIPANDRPYGDVRLEMVSYMASEEDGQDSVVALNAIRSGGLYGTLRVVYSTSEVDLVSEMLQNNENLLEQYEKPRIVDSISIDIVFHSVDIRSAAEPLITCSEACLRERVCRAFLYNSLSHECKWVTQDAVDSGYFVYASDGVRHTPSYLSERFSLYKKNATQTSILYNSQARSGVDFIPLSGASVLLHPGQQSAIINITIMEDQEPELDEYLKVSLLDVEMVDYETTLANSPTIQSPSTSRITIGENDHPYGMFVLRSQGSPTEGGTIEVEERSKLSLELMVERQGGSVGDVSVDWSVIDGTAIRNEDFTGDDATLKFAHGETSKVISLSIIDDIIPEPTESINIQLSNPTHGAVIDEQQDRANVVILANDVVGGIVGFNTESRSLIGGEGENITLHLVRTEPALGTCHVTWYGESVNGHDVQNGLNFTRGVVSFVTGQIEAELHIYITPDTTPETKEQYRIVLSHAESIDLPASGAAVVDAQASEAEISIQDSDDPHGIFRFAPTSQRIDTKEDGRSLEIFITRQFGSIGQVRIYYDVIPGTLSTLNPDIDVAQPGSDFLYNSRDSYVTFEDDVTSMPIAMEIVDDDTPELNEIFHVNLTHARYIGPNGYAVTPVLPPKIDPSGSLSQVVIDANDGTKGVLGFDPEQVYVTTTEGSTVYLRLIRDRGTYGEVTVFIFPQNRDALLDDDYSCQATTLVLGDSQQSIEYEISITDDDVPEGNEAFDVLLGSPSTGLELGNLTTATITILSNDDAHGRLSFDNNAEIYLDEPQGTNLTASTAELVVVRSPHDGVFGDIAVRFVVEQIDSNGHVIGAPVNDVTPTEGYLTLRHGVSFEVINIASVADNDAELEERFRVRLYEPENGATLDNSSTSMELIIRENDAPYGSFQVAPAGSRNYTRDIRITEGPDKLLEIDILREQGSLGTVTVDVHTAHGTAVALSQSSTYPPALAPFQALPDSTGVWFHSFRHNGHQYLVYLTSALVGSLTTPIGGSGTATSLTPGIHSTLYKWQGVYTPVQTIETDGATCATTFTSDGNLYLIITNRGSRGRHETRSRLYRLTDDALIVMQDIATKGASSVAHFYTTRHYVVVANSMDNNQVSSIDSAVFRFSGSRLEEIQTLPTRGADGLTTFTSNNNVHLAIANRYDSVIGDNSPISSVVYRWDSASNSFTQRTNVDVSHATDVEYFQLINEESYLIFSSATVRRNSVTKVDPDEIKIFQILHNDRGGDISLRWHQTLNVTRSNKIELFTTSRQSLGATGMIQPSFIRDDDVTMLMVSSHVSSRIFIFNFQSLLFTPLCDAMPATHLHPHSVSSPSRFTAIVAVATKGLYDIINVHKTNTSATNPQVHGDYIPMRKSLTFEPGQTVQTVAITVLDDAIPEKNELFQITLSNSNDHRAVIDDVTGSVNVIIESNDDAHGVIGFAQDSIDKSVEETSRDNVFTLNVKRHSATYGRVVVDWSAEGNINDVTPVSGQITFEDGQSIVGIQMTVLADDIPEVEELVEIQLSNPRLSGGTSSSLQPRLNGTSSTSMVRILANDSPHGVVGWSSNSLRTVVSEAETLLGASQLVTLEMVRDQGALGDIEVHFKTSRAENLPMRSQATPGADFITRDSSLVIRENTTRAAVAISILPDDVPEDIESFYVIIYDVTLIGDSQVGGEPGINQYGMELAEVTIDENDNARGFIQFNVTRNNEGAVDAFELPRLNNSITIPLSRLVGFVRTVGVEWLARPGTARNEDFFPSSGSVQFVDGSRSAEIEIFITDDQEVEFMESFTVQLIATTGGAKLGGDLTLTVNILPNDSPSGMFGFMQKRKRVEESAFANDRRGVVEFEVKRFQGSGDDVTLLWELESSARADLSPMTGRLAFPAQTRSRSIVLRTLPDNKLEGEEVYEVRLTAATGGAEISPVAGMAKVIIAANPGAAGTISLQTNEIFTAEPEKNYDGLISIVVERGPSVFGQVFLDWQITPADQNTFENVQGRVFFNDRQNRTRILVRTTDDDIPESAQDYVLRLVAASGGARINPSANSCLLRMVASDNPHGVFHLSQPIYHVKEGINEDTTTPMMTLSITPSVRSSYVSVTVLRSGGSFGEVAVTVESSPGSALANLDYYPINNRVIFTDGEAAKNMEVEIIDDDLPEGPKEFFVNVTGIELLSHLSNDYVTHGPFNLTRDSPPVYGDVTWAVVRIAKSDGAEGEVEFSSEAVGMRIEEATGGVRVPLVRSKGTYGSISVTVNSVNQTARRNVDFLLPSAGMIVPFEDGQTEAYAIIPIVDDAMMENDERFTLALTSASGGARIGSREFIEITITKSDYPNGVIRFIAQNDVTVLNPQVRNTPLKFTVERFGGNQLPVSFIWRIQRTEPYIAPTTSASPLNEDISSPVQGQFSFADGQGGRREIFVNILPSREEQEVEERFAIVIENSFPAEVSKEKGNATITVLKKGHPNGIVKFASTDSTNQPGQRKMVDEPTTGTAQLIFSVTRQIGSVGQLNITWSISPVNPDVGASREDVGNMNGSVIIYDGQNDADVIVSVLADDQSELDEIFLLTLTSVEGGAEIDQRNDKKLFVIRANDDPHGVFSIKSEDQQIIVTSDMARMLQVNVTRGGGSFGRVVIGFTVQFDNPSPGVSYFTTNTGTIEFTTGSTWSTGDVEISNSVFLSARDRFNIRLTTVDYVDPEMSIQPRISQPSSADVIVMSEVANPRVGFDPTVAYVYDVKRNLCKLKLSREGLYGDVTIYWTSGYPAPNAPQGVSVGRTTPSSDVITMRHLQKSANISLAVLPSVNNDAFAIHITRAESPFGGGAKMMSNRDIVDIDPSGAVHFAAFSQNVVVDRSVRELNLTVERSFGSRYDIDVAFTIIPETASPNSHYLLPDVRSIKIRNDEREGNILIRLVETPPEKSRTFLVNLTSSVQPHNIYRGLSPRIIADQRISRVTISESADARGMLSFSDATINTKESNDDGSDVLVAMVNVQRTVGAHGDVSVMVSTLGGGNAEAWHNILDTTSRGGRFERGIRHMVAQHVNKDSTTRATAGMDYEIREINVTFPEGTNVVPVPVVILDDDISEPAEAFFLFLHSPTGGSHVNLDRGLMKVIIDANDVPNGVVGFKNKVYFIDEDTPSRSTSIGLSRTHAYDSVTISWRALTSSPIQDALPNSIIPTTQPLDMTSMTWQSRTELSKQLEETSGSVTCAAHQLNCNIVLTLKDDTVAEFEETFFLEVYDVSSGAEIEHEHQVANVTIRESDSPFGMFQFAVSSRLPVITKGSKSVGLTVERIGGDSTQTRVRYSTRQMRRVLNIAGATLFPAVTDADYVTKEETVVFERGEREAFITIPLKPDSSSANPLPQIFQVALEWSSGSSKVSDRYGVANVTIVRDGGLKRVWAVYERLQQDLDDTVIHDIVTQLDGLADGSLEKEELKIFRACLDRVLEEGRSRRLTDAILTEIYQLFCKLLNPNRDDAVRGHSEFSESFDQLALCMTTQSECVPTNVNSMALTTCQHSMVQSSRWYPELINGYKFTGTGKDFFQIPTDLLDVASTGVGSSNPSCYDVYFIEYSSATWFDVPGEKAPMTDKVFSVGVDKLLKASLSTPVRYRVYTKDARISPKGAECVLWNQASSRWLSTTRGTCHVVEDSSNYVECECSHMSVYAARGPTDNLAGYNEATYAACFLALAGCLITLLCHHICMHRSTMAGRLLMHLCFACAMTQLMFVIGALTSQDVSRDACSALAIVIHYFWLAQFTWMLVQSINILQVLSFSDEQTDRMFVIHFILGWGIPAVAILLYVIVTYALGTTSLHATYGDVHGNGDMCGIVTQNGALSSAVVPACLCVLVVAIIAFHLYQKEATWKQYDDIFRGRFNSTEIPLLHWFFFLVSFTWLWGGLHLAYGQMWMLILFIISNFMQGIYVLLTYGILHNPLCNRKKNMYDAELEKPDNITQDSTGYQTAVMDQIPSVSGDVMNKSTQSLMKYEGNWDVADGSISNEQLMDISELTGKDDSADFDDLIFALKSGASVDPDEAKTETSDLEPMTSRHIASSPDILSTDDEGLSNVLTSIKEQTPPAILPIADTHL